MRRRTFFQQSMLALGSLTLSQQNLLQAMSIDPWKITMLRDDIGIFTERGGTIAFQFTKDGIVIIDAQFLDTAQHLITELKKRNPSPFHLLINTHHHGDHTAGNIAFKDIITKVLAHENSLANQKRVAIANKSEDQQYYPNETFQTKHTTGSGKESIDLYYFGAAHTNGDSVIHLKNANIVHMGDLVFNRRHPFVDRSAGANIQNWIKVLDASLKQFDANTLFICGHSGNGFDVTGKKEILSSFQNYLGNVLKFVGSEIKAGKTKEEILKATEIPGSPEWKGDGIERPLTAAFEELSA